jgi:hypothetical protein
LSSITSSDADFQVPHVVAYPLLVASGCALPVPLRFSPSTVGAKSATITVHSSDPGSPHTVQVSGEAPSGQLAVTGSLCFGGVKACCRAERTLTLCNVGDCDLHVQSVAFKRKNPHWKLVNNPFPATLHAGSCLSVVVRYKATERCPIASELVISSDDPDTPVKTLDAMAYTIWNDCGCHQKCDGCGCEGKQGCGCGGNGCHGCGCGQKFDGACDGCADDCCSDEGDD